MARATLFLFLFVAALWALSVNASPAGFTDKDLESEESLRLLYHKWVLQHGSTRNTSDERFKIFVDNVKYIDSVNKKNLTYHLGLNQFADMTEQELAEATKCIKHIGYSGDMSRVKNGSFMNQDLPTSVNWISAGAVTPVRNQGNCRSCWAFAAAAAIEGAHKIEKGELLTLSVQQLVDCTWGSDCLGGNMFDAFEYVRLRTLHYSKGLSEEFYYRYADRTHQCFDTLVPSAATIAGVEKYYGEADLHLAVSRGPVVVSVKFGHRDIRYYTGGIFNGYCGLGFDHSVLVVGYGEESTWCCIEKYWIVKNFWGTTWGENGYMRIKRSSGMGDEKCGIGYEGLLPYT